MRNVILCPVLPPHVVVHLHHLDSITKKQFATCQVGQCSPNRRRAKEESHEENEDDPTKQKSDFEKQSKQMETENT